MAIAAISASSADGKNIPGTSSSSNSSSATTTTSTIITSSSSGHLPSNSGSSNDSSRNITTTTASNNLVDSASNKSFSNKASNVVSTCATTGLDSNKKVPDDMVEGCAVCLDENASHGNQLVYCDGCNLSVHQGCYGIGVIPNGSWFCSRCASGNRHSKIKCELCPAEGGALKKTDTDKWAHVQCALWIPEVLFGDPNNVEPIILTKIHPNRWHLICYICEEKGRTEAARSGVKIDCNYKKQEQNGKNHRPTCAKHFHVTCAQQAGFLREEPKEQPANHDGILYTGYCENHFRKLKASNNISNINNNNNKKKMRSASNPSSSAMLDSASDSSQDNDSSSRRSNAIERDKNNSKRTSSKAIPTNMSKVESTTPTTTAPVNSQSSSSSTSLTASKTSARPSVNPTSTGLSASPHSVGGNGSKTNTSSSPSTTPKKKRVSKSNQGQNSTIEQTNINNNLLGIDSNNLSTQPTPNKPTPISHASTTNSQDVYDWPAGAREPDKNASTPNKSNRKKPATSSSQPLNSKSASLVNNQQAVTTGYNATKGGSPNLSISTSPSLASPSSSSTKSASNSSTSVTTSATSSSSSSSSTTSSSPSPALLSPNISNRGSTTRHESPLASNSKTSSDMSNRLAPEQMLLANSVSSTPNQLQTRTNLDNLRPDQRKSFANSSSLLSTALPTLAIDNPMQLGMGHAGDVIPSASGAPMSIEGHTKGITTTSAATSEPDSAQPSIPPLKIPVPQGSATTLQVKLAPKSRAPTRNTKKKASDVSAPIATVAPKPDPKPKSTRTRKIASTENGALVPQKLEPKARRGKANAKLTEAVASSSNTNQEDAVPKTPATSGPTKRKSRATSAESNPSTAPAPAKRIRKKKPDTPALSKESKLNPQTALTLPQSTINQQVAGPGPLMISTLAHSNQLPPGFNSDGQNVGNKYFSPMVSPYTNFDGQIAASSLSRSSLTRLFTSSSSGATTNLTNQPLDDPTKAFEDLRDYGWSQLSKCVIEQAQQFDIPNLIGTLHYLRAENEKLQNRIRDLTMKREQLTAMNARLDLPPQLLTQNLANTNPGFSSIVSSLTNSPKGLPIPSPGSAIGKQPLVITSSYNHIGPGHLGPSGFLDRSSPLVAQTHSTLNNIKSSSISTPSPPINALMAAHNNSNRAGLTVNQPYMPNSYPQMNATGQINSTPQGSSFYARQ